MDRERHYEGGENQSPRTATLQPTRETKTPLDKSPTYRGVRGSRLNLGNLCSIRLSYRPLTAGANNLSILLPHSRQLQARRQDRVRRVFEIPSPRDLDTGRADLIDLSAAYFAPLL